MVGLIGAEQRGRWKGGMLNGAGIRILGRRRWRLVVNIVFVVRVVQRVHGVERAHGTVLTQPSWTLGGIIDEDGQGFQRQSSRSQAIVKRYVSRKCKMGLRLRTR